MAAAEKFSAPAVGDPAASASTGLWRIPPDSTRRSLQPPPLDLSGAVPLDSGESAREANELVAGLFDRVAERLDVDDVDRYRIRAYRLAAHGLRTMSDDVRVVANRGGVVALVALPHIGEALAAEIVEVLHTGRLRLLERIEERACPRVTLATLPGIGATLAKRIIEALRIESLEDLEAAAHDGRLAAIPGFGVGRVRGTRLAIARALNRHPSEEGAEEGVARPPVELLIKLDARYRELASSNRLRKIAPRRFNPTHKAWLPILKCENHGWHFTLMYSNTARSHRLGKTKDWVVAYYERGGLEGRSTLVTESRGPESGYRVVRGRELSCHRYYRKHPQRPIRLPAPIF